MASSTISPQSPSVVKPLPPMSRSLMTRRRFSNGLMKFLCGFATLLAVIPLFLVLYYVVVQGIQVLTPNFFLSDLKPSGGGMRHAIAGTLLMVALASCIGLPIGILGGIYLSEFGGNRLGFAIRFAADVLNGVPSIVIGMFVYAVAVVPFKQFSAWAGGLALGIMMVPTVMRTTEEIVKLVPSALREGALALGDTRWHSTFKIVLGAARGGVITGVLLAIARISGETAPLLFTALGSNFFNLNPSQPTAALSTTIFQFATSASDEWKALAWGGSLVLITLILVLSILARVFTKNKAA